MTDIRTIIAELRELNDGPTPFATWPTDDINAVLDYIARLEAVADAARAASDCERKCSGKCPALPHEIDEVWTILRSALDAVTD